MPECKWNNCGQNQEDELIQHVNTHIESQTEYMCLWENCKKYGERQSSKYALQAHVRKHTNDRPYACNKCTKQYTRSDALNKHAKAHIKLEEEINDLNIKLENINMRRDAIEILYNRVVEEGRVLKANVELLTDEVIQKYSDKRK